ncbi:CD3324 family protein [Paenibacillus marinisediminis]
MGYVNGKDILPASLLREIQKYVQSELIYIPRECGHIRAGWGDQNGTKESLARRNQQIFELHATGASIDELMNQFHLSRDSIYKIVLKTRKMVQMQ